MDIDDVKKMNLSEEDLQTLMEAAKGKVTTAANIDGDVPFIFIYNPPETPPEYKYPEPPVVVEDLGPATEKQIEAALEEILKHDMGDGCFGCGYGGWWTPGQIDNMKPHWRKMLRHVINASINAESK